MDTDVSAAALKLGVLGLLKAAPWRSDASEDRTALMRASGGSLRSKWLIRGVRETLKSVTKNDLNFKAAGTFWALWATIKKTFVYSPSGMICFGAAAAQ